MQNNNAVPSTQYCNVRGLKAIISFDRSSLHTAVPQADTIHVFDFHLAQTHTTLWGSRQIGPWTTGPRTVGPRGPIVRGPICHFFGVDSWAQDNRAPRLSCPGPNLPLFKGGQLGPRQLGPGAQLSGAQLAGAQFA